MANFKSDGDAIQETSTVTGLNDANLDGAVPGFVAFADVYAADEAKIPYSISQAGGDFEVGFATFKTGPNRLERTVVTGSSNGGAHVNFAGGTKNVICPVTAAAAVDFVREVLVLNSFPGPTINPDDGDRLLVYPDPDPGPFTGHGNEWATWNETLGAWEFEAPTDGDQTTETGGLKRSFKWNGTQWVFIGSAASGYALEDGIANPAQFKFGNSDDHGALVNHSGASLPSGLANEPMIAVDGYYVMKAPSFTTPAAVTGVALLFVDQDGDLKCRFPSGNLVTVAVDA